MAEIMIERFAHGYGSPASLAAQSFSSLDLFPDTRVAPSVAFSLHVQQLTDLSKQCVQ